MTEEEKRRSHSASVRKYAKHNTKYYGLQLNLETDREIIEVLEKSDNKQGFIKKALKRYISCEATTSRSDASEAEN